MTQSDRSKEGCEGIQVSHRLRLHVVIYLDLPFSFRPLSQCVAAFQVTTLSPTSSVCCEGAKQSSATDPKHGLSLAGAHIARSWPVLGSLLWRRFLLKTVW